MTTPRPSYATITHHESFKHSTLRLSENSIRLFQVQPLPPNTKDHLNSSAPICLRLTQYSLVKRPPFKAISYTWGSTTNSPEILVNGRSFKIHLNLWNLLFHLRLRGETSLLWADRLCIDQENFVERNWHVRLMGRIYEDAGQVIVWLGLPGINRDEIRAMEFVREVARVERGGGVGSECASANGLRGREVEDLVNMYLDEKGGRSHRWETLGNFCGHVYWGRMWIVQEFLRARDIQVVCGRESLDWNDFETLINVMRRPEFVTHELIKPILGTRPVRLALRRRKKNLESSTLLELLSEYWDSRCTERRDKVYGILGLASDCVVEKEEDGKEGDTTYEGRGIRPDYKKHIVQVYLDTVKCIEDSLNDKYMVLSVVNLVRRTLSLKEADFTDFIMSRTEDLGIPRIHLRPGYVGVVKDTISWTSINDLKQKLQQFGWGEYVGYEVRSARPGLGRRSSARAIHTALPDDMVSNVIQAAEMEAEIDHLHNHPSTNGLVIPLEFIALHLEDKRLQHNTTLQKPTLIIEQLSDHIAQSPILRLGFACTDTRKGDYIFQFCGLDFAYIGRETNYEVNLVGKAVMIRHAGLETPGQLDSICTESAYFSSCLPRNLGLQEDLTFKSDALSLAELVGSRV